MSIDEGMQVTTRTTGGAMADVEAQRAMAETQVRMLVAKKFPRDVNRAIDRIMQACTRPTLAEVAVYAYPRGDQMVTGPSIRLAEAIAQNYGNIEFGIKELSNSNGESEVMAEAVDLETTTRSYKVFRVKHWRDTRKGGYAITDSRDIYEMVANQGARRLRACILGVIPGDIVDAALRQCEITQQSSAGAPEEQIEKLISAFAEYGVTTEQIAKRLRHGIKSTTSAEIVALKRVYTALRDGMGKVADYFEVEAEEPEAVAAQALSKAEALAAALAARQKAAEPGPDQRVAAPAAPVAPETPAKPAATPKPRKKVEPVDIPFPPANETPRPDIDPETGEVLTKTMSGGAGPSYATIMSLVNGAGDMDELQAALSLMSRSAIPEDQKNELRAEIKRRAADLQ